MSKFIELFLSIATKINRIQCLHNIYRREISFCDHNHLFAIHNNEARAFQNDNNIYSRVAKTWHAKPALDRKFCLVQIDLIILISSFSTLFSIKSNKVQRVKQLVAPKGAQRTVLFESHVPIRHKIHRYSLALRISEVADLEHARVRINAGILGLICNIPHKCSIQTDEKHREEDKSYDCIGQVLCRYRAVSFLPHVLQQLCLTNGTSTILV
mmetsp:Transcript_10917/g.12844  ORF Transcript_10917/g.12844 Transcript_10917/m.12844 type:complete len:212 (+) Transcript_10917:476-1111(+)